ncbi:MAG: helix-turn-helix domain-containing protein [Christensenellaceae bacterium]|jgi:transcriptional regulator with XRE-family HTH domain|nr:helix-turn-helix domain-containing protein [Christensenellaceae bacterium]
MEEIIENEGDYYKKWCFANIITEIIVKNDLEIEDFANMLGVSESEVMRWLCIKSMPGPARLNRIAEKFNLMTDEVLNGGLYGLRDTIEFVFGTKKL